MFVDINGKTHCLWRTADHEGEVLQSAVTDIRDRKAALRFLNKFLRRYVPTEQIVTDRLRFYEAAVRQLGARVRQHSARHANNRAENPPAVPPTRARAMLRFYRMRTRQKFVAVHACVSNHFNQDRALSRRQHFKDNRTAALNEWRLLCAA